MRPRGMGRTLNGLLACLACHSLAQDAGWEDVAATHWRGTVDVSVPALKRRSAAIIALPASEARPLEIVPPAPLPAGSYAVRLTLRPSHVGDVRAFHSGVSLTTDGHPSARFEGPYFARAHEPETRTALCVHERSGPLALRLEAFSDAQAFEAARIASELKLPAPGARDAAWDPMDGDDPMGLALEEELDPDRAVYYLVDRVELRRLSGSGQVRSVTVDKIRYRPGATLHGVADVADVGGKGGKGELRVSLEHGVAERVTVATLPVTLGPQAQAIPFEVTLPERELGYALVAEYVSADGTDRSEASAEFSIAANFQRVAIFGGGLATRDVVQDDATIRASLAKARSGYVNATEYFAWAEDDLVEMSPDGEFWSSGQTNYRLHKRTLRRQIELAHEQGIAVATYGKFCMSGLKGWEAAYDYPLEHRGQYRYPVGMWNGVNAVLMDRRRDGDFRIYSKSPNVSGNPFQTWWSEFLPVTPDDTPGAVRRAAEECLRSIGEFGWDAIRWDGHPRGGGQCGRSGQYDAAAARKTQALVRYFKDIVASRQPGFAHGYNYLLIEKDKGYDWAVADYELDELCRGGGLVMNESIGNASGGWTFAQVARNLQVDGDLCRERGGFYLGISFAQSPRDILIESALWAAAGCRPYNDAMSREVRRYCTRFSQFTFDERLRRLADPGQVLAPAGETPLWWQPFVYETPLVAGKRQLVVNLLNVPLQDQRPPRDGKAPPVWTLPPGTAPVSFALTLPEGLRATAAWHIDPWTLAVNPLAMEQGRLVAPSVALWQVMVIDLAVGAGAPSLAALHGAPATLGRERPDPPATPPVGEVVLDPSVEIWEVNKRVDVLSPEWVRRAEKRQADLDALSGAALDEALLALRETPEALERDWWKGGSLPADRALQGKVPDFGDLAPRRDGRFDLYHARGMMDYRLRMWDAIARLDRFRVHDAPLWGVVRQSPGMGLAHAVPWCRFPEFDVLLFTGIPHAAIGAENSYALVEYVKAGGAALFTGGEYAFGKGGYMHTVLERELLPWLCAGMQDTVYSATPQAIGPGPDFEVLGLRLDFADKPSFWVRNQGVLKPGAKVFLASGGHPVLVGWDCGRGRVACLLVDHRGKSDGKVTAFFDWKDWPRLVEGVLRWLAPDASKVDAPVPMQGREAFLAELRKVTEGDLFAGLDDPGLGLDMGGAGTAAAPAVALTGEALKRRVALLDRALGAGGADLAALLATQLGMVRTLPQATRMRIVAALWRERPPEALAVGKGALAAGDALLRGSGSLLLAVAGSPLAVAEYRSPGRVSGETQAEGRERLRDLAMAVAVFPGDGLVDEVRRRVEEWDRQEEKIRTAFAAVVGDDVAMLETSPCLDAEALLARLACLSYLSRRDPAFAGPFLREWLRIGLYQDYCSRSIQHVQGELKLAAPVAEPLVEGWRNLSARLGALREWTEADARTVAARMPEAVKAAAASARFTAERLAAFNLTGARDVP